MHRKEIEIDIKLDLKIQNIYPWLRTGNNTKNAVAVSEMLTRLISIAFSFSGSASTIQHPTATQRHYQLNNQGFVN
jgi:siderophore synthetase component